jgi:hypothetical protein
MVRVACAFVEEAWIALAMYMVFLQITIPVPGVRRVVEAEYGNFIAMEFIPGRTVSEA